jgi:hypothetical protein
MMSNELIIEQLKNKEAQLINELNKVRLALEAFIDENMNFGNTGFQKYAIDDLVPKTYTADLTYGSKILFVLYTEGKPLMVDDIVTAIHTYEPALNTDKLLKNISHNLSMLAKYSKIKKHPFNRKIKYSL